jgi:hypothetical protein
MLAPVCGAVVADQPAREADQDRRQGRQPRPLRDLPDGRGRSLFRLARVRGGKVRPAAGNVASKPVEKGTGIGCRPEDLSAITERSNQLADPWRSGLVGTPHLERSGRFREDLRAPDRREVGGAGVAQSAAEAGYRVVGELAVTRSHLTSSQSELAELTVPARRRAIERPGRLSWATGRGVSKIDPRALTPWPTVPIFRRVIPQ